MNGNTLSANGPPTTVSGTVLSLASSGLIVGSQTLAFPAKSPDPIINENHVITFAGQTFTQVGSDVVAFHGMTLTANGPATTISGTTISLVSSTLFINGQPFPLPTPAPSAPPSAVVTIDGTTLTAGATAVTVSGNRVGLASGSAGFYLTGHGTGTGTFSLPITAGASASMDAADVLSSSAGMVAVLTSEV